jgi:predicted dienelactone hydrolase
MFALLLLWACGAETVSTDMLEPLDLPDDPSAVGVPVGVQTVEWSGRVLEVWYPASDRTDGTGESIDLGAWIPDLVSELLGEITLPPVQSIAVRDAPVRRAEQPYPVVIFSHGFGGMRVQSVDLTTHLASRGYVVIATEHAGRSTGDLLPCLFQPPVEGCNIGFDDVGPYDVEALITWVDEAAATGPFAEVIDPDHIGLFGHSAGGGTTTTAGETNERLSALFPMAGGGAITRDVPTLYIAGQCDGSVPAADTALAASSSAAPYVEVEGAGHLAFSDLCTLDLTALSAPLADRDDVSATFLELITSLGTDGCPPTPPTIAGCNDYVDPVVTAPPIKHVMVRHFDAHLYGISGDLIGDWDALTLVE